MRKECSSGEFLSPDVYIMLFSVRELEILSTIRDNKKLSEGIPEYGVQAARLVATKNAQKCVFRLETKYINGFSLFTSRGRC